ncbi:unnamed protein product [Trichobilharzia regenti]|nr:unnamed protein product [Trichobilharzia regenti]
MHQQSGSLLLTVRTKQPTLLPIRDIRISTISLYDSEISLEVGTICYGGMDPEQFSISDTDGAHNTTGGSSSNNNYNKEDSNQNTEANENKSNFETVNSDFKDVSSNIRLMSKMF